MLHHPLSAAAQEKTLRPVNYSTSCHLEGFNLVLRKKWGNTISLCKYMISLGQKTTTEKKHSWRELNRPKANN